MMRSAVRALVRGREPQLPVTAFDTRPSAVSSVIDLEPQPTPELIRLMLASAQQALDLDLADVAARAGRESAGWLRLWPGEHYRFLAGLVAHLQPRSVVEIGTFQGLGALSILETLPVGSELVSFDVVPWRDIDGCLLRDDDFADGRLRQEIGDLSDPTVFERHRELLAGADLVFLDAPKDGRFEPAFLELAVPLWRATRSVLVIDDIRLLPMLQVWRDLPFPKLDATSVGHWSGTGLALTG